jgi:hypothetical protein
MAEIATSHKTLLAMTEQEKTQIPLTPFAKGGKRFLGKYFHHQLVPQCGMRVYPENTIL